MVVTPTYKECSKELITLSIQWQRSELLQLVVGENEFVLYGPEGRI